MKFRDSENRVFRKRRQLKHRQTRDKEYFWKEYKHSLGCVHSNCQRNTACRYYDVFPDAYLSALNALKKMGE